ncbi:hypothetical protein C2E23DRAFT_744335 [Lenzites betulinus]|nr:hypothetical protein C2E23DRAFT_744335 [Lenzites betulinus]
MSHYSAHNAITLDPLPRYPEIILALNVLDPRPPLFHWVLYVSVPGATRDRLSAGTRMHLVCGLAPDGKTKVWSFTHSTYVLGTSMTVAAAAVIGRLPPGRTVRDLVGLLQEIPMAVPEVEAQREQRFTCRVWIREAVRRMHTRKYICCPDVYALEAEMLQYAEEFLKAVRERTPWLARLVTAVNSSAVQ